MSAKTDPLPPVVVTRMEVRMQDPNVSIQQITVAQITLEGGQWVLEVLPGQRVKPEALMAMDGRWVTKAKTVDEARETLAEAAHALVAMLDAQAAERQAFMRRINKATGERQATLPLGEHDPLDDREPEPDWPPRPCADAKSNDHRAHRYLLGAAGYHCPGGDSRLVGDVRDEPCTCGNAILHARECPKSPL